MTSAKRATSLGRQILAGYVAMLVVMIVLVVVAVAALGSLGDAKDRVIEQDMALVVGARELAGAAGQKSVANRSLVLTGDADHRLVIDEQRARLDHLLDEMGRRPLLDRCR